jgi:hypothetical protein
MDDKNCGEQICGLRLTLFSGGPTGPLCSGARGRSRVPCHHTTSTPEVVSTVRHRSRGQKSLTAAKGVGSDHHRASQAFLHAEPLPASAPF